MKFIKSFITAASIAVASCSPVPALATSSVELNGDSVLFGDYGDACL